VAAVVASLTACRSGSDDPEGAAAPGAAVTGASFRSSNGLYFPPELWSAVGESREAAMLRALATAQVGGTLDRTPWAAKDTPTLLADESSPLEAAWLVAQGPEPAGAGSGGGSTPLTGWAVAISSGDWLQVWMADDLDRARGGRAVLSAADRTRLEAARTGSDALGQHVATVVLARRDGVAAPPLPTLPERARTDSPREAALLLMLRGLGGEQPDVRNAGLVPSLLAAARTDDWVLYYLTRAYAAAGRVDSARAVLARFDTRRVLPDGSLLEVPEFNGSVGSTFRMVRYHSGRQDLDDFLGKGGRGELARTLSGQRGVDALHALAVTATLALLDPSSVAPAERRTVVETAVTTLVPGTAPMTLEQAVAWTQLAEYARSLDVPMPYRGLAPSAVQRWQEVSPDVAAPTLARFLRARGAAAKGDPQAEALLPVLRAALTSRPTAQIESSILVTGSLALHAIEGSWPLEPSVVSAALEGRWGGCRGDFDGYLRESAASSSVCNVDDSYAALDLPDAAAASAPTAPTALTAPTAPTAPTASAATAAPAMGRAA
jgi:hypothetical protein